MFLLGNRSLKRGGPSDGKGGSEPSTSVPARRVVELEHELESARLLNAQLQEQLECRGPSLVGEYLYCYRTVALPLLGNEWELRYFVLSGQALKQYKSAKDLCYNPREETSVMGCSVEWEGLCQGTHWAFSVLDPSGSTLLRLAALSKPVALKWMAALEAAGCKRRSFEDTSYRSVQSSRQLPGRVSTLSPMASAPLHRRSLSIPLNRAMDDTHASSAQGQQGQGAGHGRGRSSEAGVGPSTSSPRPAVQGKAARGRGEDSGGSGGASVPAGFASPATQGKGGRRVSAGGGGGSAAAHAEPGRKSRGGGEGAPAAMATAAGAVPPATPFAVPLAARAAAAAMAGGPGQAGTVEASGSAEEAPAVSGGAEGDGVQAEEGQDPGQEGPEASVQAPKRHKQMLASTPVHTAVRFSYLSSERMWHEKHSGLYNLAAVILVASNLRLALENALKYGWRYSPLKLLPGLTIGNPNLPLALCYPTMLLLALSSLVTELVAYRFLLMEAKIYSGLVKKSSDNEPSPAELKSLSQRRRLHEWLIWWCSFANSTAVIGIPWAVIHETQAEPISGGVLIMLACILWMKLVSYHHVCWDLRAARREANYWWPGSDGRSIGGVGSSSGNGNGAAASEDSSSHGGSAADNAAAAAAAAAAAGPSASGDIAHHAAASAYDAGVRPGERGSANSPAEWALLRYPENLNVRHLAYFLAAPTLTYQVNYPRTHTIRTKWLGRRIFELIIVLTAGVLLVTQYIEPAVANSMKPLKEMDWLHIVERVLRLSLPNTYAWLCMFYCLFHLWLNIVAELLRFGDREFYKDWWNASTVGEYWKLWNMPVHKWLLRHVYFPAIRLGMSRYSSMVLVFFVSAVFHELVLGVPLHMVRLWAFSGIMLQVPLIMVSDQINRRLKSDQWGNIIFWLSFCVVGQPVTMLIYYHDYMKMRESAAQH